MHAPRRRLVEPATVPRALPLRRKKDETVNLPEAHRFLTILACDWCGHKIPFDATARATMTEHLAGHPQSRYAAHPEEETTDA